MKKKYNRPISKMVIVDSEELILETTTITESTFKGGFVQPEIQEDFGFDDESDWKN